MALRPDRLRDDPLAAQRRVARFDARYRTRDIVRRRELVHAALAALPGETAGHAFRRRALRAHRGRRRRLDG
ncbi:MAG: hypothetical protein ACRDR6_02275 [Pseudonocardiaceae bacterium]